MSIKPSLIDWGNPKDRISDHFTVHDALYLPSWMIYHHPSDEEKASILKVADKLDQIRDLLQRPISVDCWIRPIKVNSPDNPQYLNRNYNAIVGGAPHSCHIDGRAVDFRVATMTADDVRFFLEEELVKLNIRMEDKKASTWTHIDIGEVLPGHNRFFKP